MAAPIVVLDACVLYPAALRDLLMRLAVHGLIQPKWSEMIHQEWMTAVLRERGDLTRTQLEKVRHLMDQHATDALVTGHERHIAALNLPDPQDRHVLAVAIEAEAQAIITWNLKDFPKTIIRAQAIDVMTPDALVSELIRKDAESVLMVMQEHRASLKRPPKSEQEYLETLLQQGLRRSVGLVKQAGSV